MARTDELTRRAGRLVAGERNAGDLYALFLWLRERSFGNSAVAELGDFVAHSDERDRGVAWRGAQDFLTMVQYHLPRIKNAAITTISDFQGVAWATFGAMSAADIKTKTGLRKSKAKKVLAEALSAISSFDGKIVELHRPITDKEAEILRLFTTCIISRSAFTSDDLVSQFLVCLFKNGLIESVPQVVDPALSAFIALYAVERMHLARVLLPDGKVATLQAASGPFEGKECIQIFAAVPVDLSDGKISVAFPVYSALLSPWDWCEPELHPERPFGGTNWDFPLEIGPNGKLKKF